MKILIVDDSEMVRNYYYYILKNEGYDVVSAIDGADGLEKILTVSDISCILSDINMPNMDGYTMIERIRAAEGFEDIPIIIISTEEEAEDKEKGYNAGADVYIVKPIDPQILIENINLLIGE
jgi:two-component system chemotaxis response regulator CheY